MFDNKIYEKITKFETPFYLYDEETIVHNIDILNKTLPPNICLFYSMKANPSLGLCQLVRQCKCGIEIASNGELEIALKAGFKGDKIIFTSPGKTKFEIIQMLKHNISVINVDSYREIELINTVAKQMDKNVRIAIRINPKVINSGAKIKMTGMSSQFGIEEDELEHDFFDKVKKLCFIKLVGFQVYMGTQMLNANDIYLNTKNIMILVMELTKKYNINLSYINFGGGFGVPYFKNESALDMHYLERQLKLLFETYKDFLNNVHIVFESGRYIMAEGGQFITKVLYVKRSKENKYVICDGGSNCHSSAAFLGRFVRNNFPIYVYPDSNEKETCTITGPLCTPMDIIGQKIDVKKDVKEGDYVVVKNSGAYGLTYSPIGFLSHEIPMELLYSHGKIKILRERGKTSDYLINQNTL